MKTARQYGGMHVAGVANTKQVHGLNEIPNHNVLRPLRVGSWCQRTLQKLGKKNIYKKIKIPHERWCVAIFPFLINPHSHRASTCFLISRGTPTLAQYAVGLHSPVDKKTIVCCKRRAEYVVGGSNTVVAQRAVVPSSLVECVIHGTDNNKHRGDIRRRPGGCWMDSIGLAE